MQLRRNIIFSIVAVLALAGTYSAYRYFTPVQGQFGYGYYTTRPPEVLQAACAATFDPATNTRSPSFYTAPGCYGSTGMCFGKSSNNDFQCTYGECPAYNYYLSDVPECMHNFVYAVPVMPGGICMQNDCCNGGQYHEEFMLDCVQGTQCLPVTGLVGYGDSPGYRCCSNPDATTISECNPPVVTSASSQSSSSAPRCGDGVRQPNGADGQAGTSDDEECDAGTNNIPESIANKDWLDLTQSDANTLDNSNCLETCKIAQCSDGEDNDEEHGTDSADPACRAGALGEGAYLPG